MILYLVEKGVALDVADALPGEQLEGWYTIFINREKDRMVTLAKMIMGSQLR